jgi:signal transduction histidine kinase
VCSSDLEINNPLNVMYGNLRLLKYRIRKTRDHWKVAQMVRDALAAAESARRVIEEFRHFANVRREAEMGDLGACIEEAVRQVRPLAGKRVSIRCSFGRVPAAPIVEGQIRRAVANLLKNAIESIDGKGRIEIALSCVGKHARIEVRDTGRGMEKAVSRRIYEPFFTTKEGGRGFGLGLSLCQAIVQNHGGDISVRSGVGRGTTFTIRLPLGPSPKSTVQSPLS